MNPLNQIEGFFIEFDKNEIKELRYELERQGYTADCAGIKNFLLDSLFGESDAEPEDNPDTERIIRKARNFIRENPAAINLGINLVSGIGKKIFTTGGRK